MAFDGVYNKARTCSALIVLNNYDIKTMLIKLKENNEVKP